MDTGKEIVWWENTTKSGIHTEVKKTSRLVQAKLIPSFEAKESQQAQHQIFSQLPEESKKTATVDNGTDFRNLN